MRITLSDRESELETARGRVEELEERGQELDGLVKKLEDDLVTVRQLYTEGYVRFLLLIAIEFESSIQALRSSRVWKAV